MEIDLEKCALYSITPNQWTMMHLMKKDKFNDILSIFTKQDAFSMRKILIERGFLNSDGSGKFIYTTVNTDKYNKLLGITDESINFWEWYTLYPVRFGSRVFRAAKENSEKAKKHKKKYLAKIKSKDAHDFAIATTTAFITNQTDRGKLAFLPDVERVLNNSEWEVWESFLTESEQKTWQTDEI